MRDVTEKQKFKSRSRGAHMIGYNNNTDAKTMKLMLTTPLKMKTMSVKY